MGCALGHDDLAPRHHEVRCRKASGRCLLSCGVGEAHQLRLRRPDSDAHVMAAVSLSCGVVAGCLGCSRGCAWLGWLGWVWHHAGCAMSYYVVGGGVAESSHVAASSPWMVRSAWV